MDPDRPDVLPTDDADRRDWIRYHLPRLGLRREAELRVELRERGGLTDMQVDVLLSFFAQKELWSGVPRSRRGELDLFRSWTARVLGIEVELRPGGRAIMREPQWDRATSSWKPWKLGDARVELQWRSHGKGGRGKPEFRPHEARVIAGEEGFGLPPPDLWEFLAAFFVRLGRESPSAEDLARLKAFAEGAQPRPPRAGTPPDHAYYRGLLSRYEALVRDGSVRPVQQLAEEEGLDPNTMKSRLRRGRRYTQGGGSR